MKCNLFYTQFPLFALARLKRKKKKKNLNFKTKPTHLKRGTCTRYGNFVAIFSFE